MPTPVTDVDQLQAYIQGVIGRADHHAKRVDNIALMVAGAIVGVKSGPITVNTVDGAMKNVLWFGVGDRKFRVRYNHNDHTIEVLPKGNGQSAIAAFDNSTPLHEVKDFFFGLDDASI